MRRALLAACVLGAAAATVHSAVNARLMRRRGARTPVDRTVAALVPARDEAARIAPCLRSLLAQRDVPGLEILVLDDGSTDGTADVVAAVAANPAVQSRASAPRLHRTGPAVRVLTGAELPAGWLGKPHACHQLAARTDADVLVFVDADVVLAPDAVAAAVDQLDTYGLDLVSPYPRQLTGTPAERLVQPLLQWSWLTFLPLRAAERSSRPSMAAANGQFLAVRRTAYEKAGGHAAVRDQVIEDIALLRAVTAAGGRGVVTDGSELATCRMYTSWPELRDGYTKSLWAAFGSPAGAVATVGLLAALYVLPAVAALRGSRLGLAGYAFGVAGRLVTARASGGRSFPDALAHPASVVLFGWLVARSYVRRDVMWKGRPVRA